MRELGSASVAKVAELNLEGLGPGIVRRMVRSHKSQGRFMECKKLTGLCWIVENETCRHA